MAAAGLSDESIEEFREAFTLFDRNQDGTVNSKDLGNVLKAIGQNPSDEETRQLVQRFDMDGTGSIDFPEFLTLIAKIQKEALDDKDEIREAFTVFDKDGTGFLSKEKVKELIEELGIPLEEIEMKQMMESFRFNSEGKINVEQFVKVVFNDLKQM